MPLIENAEPATDWVWSSGSDQVTVTDVPSPATDAPAIVGAVVSTSKDRVAEKPEWALELSTSSPRQKYVPSASGDGLAEPLAPTARLVTVESNVCRMPAQPASEQT